MKNFEIQDPITFGLPNKEKVKEVVELFFSNQKEKFLNAYNELTNTDKFYALSVCVAECANLEMGKRIFLQELRADLQQLKACCLLINFNTKEILYRISFEYFGVKNYKKEDTWEQLRKPLPFVERYATK
jgi:hypothetical protein